MTEIAATEAVSGLIGKPGMGSPLLRRAVARTLWAYRHVDAEVVLQVRTAWAVPPPVGYRLVRHLLWQEHVQAYLTWKYKAGDDKPMTHFADAIGVRLEQVSRWLAVPPVAVPNYRNREAIRRLIPDIEFPQWTR